MTLSIPAPPLIGGVSQQSKGLRLESQVARQDNAWSSVVDGLVKRQPSQHLGRMFAGDAGYRQVHWIDDGSAKYVAVFGDESVLMYDESGNTINVVGRDGGAADYTYLATTGTNNIRAVTAGDATFVLNREIPVTGNAGVANPHFVQDFNRTGYVFVRSGQYDSRYKIVVRLEDNGVALPNFTVRCETWDGTDDDPDSDEITSIRTNAIADELETGQEGGAGFTQIQAALTAIDPIAFPGADISITQEDSVIRFAVENPRLKIVMWKVTDSSGDSLMTGWQREIERVSDLPTRGFEGNVVKITGTSDDLDAADDYWVIHRKDDEGGGRWEETVDPDTEIALDRSTMPHLLVKAVSDGTVGLPPAGDTYFIWDTQVDDSQRWAYMAVGSAENESNPFPSFVTPVPGVDRPIDDIFFWQNRLGLLSGQNVIMSEAGVYFNFFRTTVRQLLDSDPIDLTVGHAQLHRLHSAEPEDESLWVYSGTTQFEVQGDGILSPRTVRVEPRLSYDNDPDVHPVGTGRGTFFAVTRGDYSGVRELIKIDDTTVDAPDVSVQVPRYIKGRITQLARSTVANVLAVRTDGEPNVVYLYRYFWNGNEKIQSAWFRYTFESTSSIRSVGFFENELFLAIQREHGLYLEKLDLEERKGDPDSTWVVSIDRRTSNAGVSRAYNAGSDTTTITFPYAIDAEAAAVVTTRPGGVVLGTVSQAGPLNNLVTVSGDHSSDDLWLGTQYTMDVELAEPVLRERSRSGGFSSRINQRAQVPQAHIAFRDSAYFTITVDGDPVSFSAFVPGDSLDTVSLESGTFTFPVWQGDTAPVVTLTNATPHPSNFEEMEWAVNTLARTGRWRA